MPMVSDSARTLTPRMNGIRTHGWSAGYHGRRWTSVEISPSGSRTASAQRCGPRIMTPSTRAWPPMDGRPCPPAAGAWPLTSRSDAGRAAPVLLLEALHPASGVHELLLARVEGMALRADLDLQVCLRRPGLKRVPARAPDVRQYVVGMDPGLHRCFLTYSYPAP